MDKIFIITRASRYDERPVKAYKSEEKANEYRMELLKKYPFGNYLIREIDFQE